MAEVTVRLAALADTAAVAGQLEAMDRHYDEPVMPGKADYERFARETLLAPDARLMVALAFDGDRVVGSAFFGALYPAEPLCGTMFVKDLFVMEDARRGGIGEKLMRFVAQMAQKHGCSRIELTTANDNTRARALYDRLGGKVDDRRVFYQIKGAALDHLAAS